MPFKNFLALHLTLSFEVYALTHREFILDNQALTVLYIERLSILFLSFVPLLEAIFRDFFLVA